MAINWTPARLEVDLNYKSKDIVLASEWNNLWKETRLQGNNNTDGIVLLIETVEGNVTHLTNLDNLFSDLESKVTAHTGNSDIHVTALQKTAWTAKYDKPSGGIPKSDLASNVQSSLEKADTALQQHQDISALTNHVANNNIHVTVDNKTAWNAKYDKPTGGIPKSDLASAVQTSLGKADTALQQHQDISALTNHVANNDIHVTTDNKTAWNAKYDKPSGGIPKSDLASAVQTSLVPSSLSSDSGKVLTVSSSGDAVWAEATSSGSSGAEVFLVTFTQDVETETYSADKTFAEIMAAYESGKVVRCSVLSDSSTLLGELVSANTGYVCFGVEMVNEGIMAGISVYVITSDNIVEWNFFNFYMPRFFLETLNASEWTNGEYSGFDTTYPSSLFDIEIELDSTATSEQLEAWSNAKLTSVFPTNKIKALGDVPTVNIPVIVKLIFSFKMHGPSGPK